MLGPGDAVMRTAVPVLGAGAGVPRHRGAHRVARIGVFHPQAAKVLADGTYLAELTAPSVAMSTTITVPIRALSAPEDAA